jgi:hypothetical protein
MAQARKRWRQFGLRTLLALVLVAAVGLGYLRYRYEGHRREYQRERAIVAEIERLGGRVTWELHGPEWVRRFGEYEVFLRAVHVACDVNTNVPEVAKRLEGLSVVEGVFLLDSDATPEVLEALGAVSSLRHLHLNFTHVIEMESDWMRRINARTDEVKAALPGRVEVQWTAISN